MLVLSKFAQGFNRDRFDTWNFPGSLQKYEGRRNPSHHLCTHLPALFSDLPPGFHGLATVKSISPDTIRLIQRIAARQNWSVWERSYSPGNTVAYGDPWADAIHNDYESACPALSLPDGPGGPPLEKLICLALIRYCLNKAVYERSRACIFHQLSIELFEKLPGTFPSSRMVDRRALLWVYTMTIDSWAMWDKAISDEATYLFLLMEQVFPETLSWISTDFEYLGQQYLWTENISKILQHYYRNRPVVHSGGTNLVFN